mgnify:FL=1
MKDPCKCALCGTPYAGRWSETAPAAESEPETYTQHRLRLEECPDQLRDARARIAELERELAAARESITELFGTVKANQNAADREYRNRKAAESKADALSAAIRATVVELDYSDNRSTYHAKQALSLLRAAQKASQ